MLEVCVCGFGLFDSRISGEWTGEQIGWVWRYIILQLHKDHTTTWLLITNYSDPVLAVKHVVKGEPLAFGIEGLGQKDSRLQRS